MFYKGSFKLPSLKIRELSRRDKICSETSKPIRSFTGDVSEGLVCWICGTRRITKTDVCCTIIITPVLPPAHKAHSRDIGYEYFLSRLLHSSVCNWYLHWAAKKIKNAIMKESDVKTIWQIPKYLPYVHPSLTDEIIANAEKKIGYALPKEYIEILKNQNGGYIRFTLPEKPHGQIYGIGPHFPSLTDFDWSEYEGIVSFKLNGLVPFDGDGHWYVCLDYRQNKLQPEITFIDTESDYEKPVAKNFQEYLNLLEIETGNEFVIETDMAIEDFIKKLQRFLTSNLKSPILSITATQFIEVNTTKVGFG
jgi:SMI1-KNR4 cell-wall